MEKDKHENCLFPFKNKIQKKRILADTYTPLTVKQKFIFVHLQWVTWV